MIMDGNRMVITDHPSDMDCTLIRGIRIKRCNGCAQCIKGDVPVCSIEDDITPVLSDMLNHETLEIRTDVLDGWFAMPMRKVIERLSNILQTFTDAGGNDPHSIDDVSLRKIVVKVRSESKVESLETDAVKLLKMGPVETISFDYE